MHKKELEKKIIAETIQNNRATNVNRIRDDFALAENLDRETTEDEERVMRKKVELQKTRDAHRNTITNPLALLGQMAGTIFEDKSASRDNRVQERKTITDKKKELFAVDFELKEFGNQPAACGDFVVANEAQWAGKNFQALDIKENFMDESDEEVIVKPAVVEKRVYDKPGPKATLLFDEDGDDDEAEY